MHWSDPYAVLKVTRDSDDFTIRQAYRRALLSNHPDKITANGNEAVVFTIDDINEAYRQIRRTEGESKDNRAPTADSPCIFSETIDLSDFEELELQDGSLEWVRDCRCGEKGYVLQEQELELNGDADEIAVQCVGCSLWILVQYSTE